MAKKTGCPRGRLSRLPKEQTKFLSSFWSSWDDARAENDRSIVSFFYNDIATKFLEKFGPPGIKLADEELDTSEHLNAEAQGSNGTHPTFDINTLDPQLRAIGPNNTTTSHASVDPPLPPPVTQDVPSSSSSEDPLPVPSDASQSDWNKARAVCIFFSAFFVFCTHRTITSSSL